LRLSQVRSFKTATEAGVCLKDKIQPGDIILVKGSQNNVRAERAIEVIMKEPLDAKKILVRQSAFWQEKA
jgi:UDP-N-acetylmuramyl pentapeptide synthase